VISVVFDDETKTYAAGKLKSVFEFRLAHANGTIRMYNTLTGKVMAHSNYSSKPQDMSDESTVACIRYRPSTIIQ